MLRPLFFILLFILGSLSYADQAAFEQTRQKKWSDYSVTNAVFYSDNNRAGVVVHLSNFNSQPNYEMHYDDRIIIPGLIVNPNLGKYGAIVHQPSQTVCAYRTFFRYKESGLCALEIADKLQAYTVRLRIK